MMTPDLLARAKDVRLFLMDVDGVLTDGKLFYVPAGDVVAETKGFNAQDGIALQWLRWNEIKTGVISGRVSPATEERARQVGMTYVIQGHIEKVPVLEQIVAESGIPLSQIAFAGDDFTDIPVLRRVGLAFAPANARQEVKRAAHFVSSAKGGDGAVREMCEIILQARGVWNDLLKKYEVA